MILQVGWGSVPPRREPNCCRGIWPSHRISRIRKWPMNASVGESRLSRGWGSAPGMGIRTGKTTSDLWVKSWAVKILGREFFGYRPPKIKIGDFQVVDSFAHIMKKDETRIWGVKLQVTKSPPTWEAENYKHHLPKSHQTCLVPPFQLKPPFKTALYRVTFNKNWVFFL